MPMYVYAVVQPDGGDGETFEVLQGMSEPALTAHPRTGQPVRRVFGMPNVGKSGRDLTSDANLARHGFSKFENQGDGRFDKVV